jgi:large subunit ribosomal protein L18
MIACAKVFREAATECAQLRRFTRAVTTWGGSTLCTASSLLELDERPAPTSGGARGREADAKRPDKKIENLGGYVYHGRIKELADGAREGGLKF